MAYYITLPSMLHEEAKINRPIENICIFKKDFPLKKTIIGIY